MIRPSEPIPSPYSPPSSAESRLTSLPDPEVVPQSCRMAGRAERSCGHNQRGHSNPPNLRPGWPSPRPRSLIDLWSCVSPSERPRRPLRGNGQAADDKAPSDGEFTSGDTVEVVRDGVAIPSSCRCGCGSIGFVYSRDVELPASNAVSPFPVEGRVFDEDGDEAAACSSSSRTDACTTWRSCPSATRCRCLKPHPSAGGCRAPNCRSAHSANTRNAPEGEHRSSAPERRAVVPWG